jgi:hypothetical protein
MKMKGSGNLTDDENGFIELFIASEVIFLNEQLCIL